MARMNAPPSLGVQGPLLPFTVRPCGVLWSKSKSSQRYSPGPGSREGSLRRAVGTPGSCSNQRKLTSSMEKPPCAGKLLLAGVGTTNEPQLNSDPSGLPLYQWFTPVE